MKVLFMGTPAIAASVLQSLYDAGHEIVGVVTQPDKSRDRGMKASAPAVKTLAVSLGLPVYQPETLKNEAIKPLLEELQPELIAVAAYGKILPSYVLDYPVYGSLCVHASLLPKYRGAAPIQRAIMGMEKETGITIIYMDKGIDTGDMLLHAKVAIAPTDTTETLTDRLAAIGGPLLNEAIEAIREGKAVRRKQDDSLSNYAPMMSREDGVIDWTKSAEAISAQIRGCDPWPVAESCIDGVRLKLYQPSLAGVDEGLTPGTVKEAGKKGLTVACGGGTLLTIGEVQPAGKKRMAAAAYFNGHPIKEKVIR